VETAVGRLVLWRVHPGAGPARGGAAPGAFVAADDGLALVAADGLLHLDEVQLAGGRRMSGADLRRGRPGLVGTVVAPASRGAA
ncbi:MAG TPA: hypothetical protein VMH24_09190, partial [Candidatus Sulfotelmatobacter sp.]|nr:hypothetical protein [Candidatus Sulfotelmatobacter sp.]